MARIAVLPASTKVLRAWTRVAQETADTEDSPEEFVEADDEPEEAGPPELDREAEKGSDSFPGEIEKLFAALDVLRKAVRGVDRAHYIRAGKLFVRVELAIHHLGEWLKREKLARNASVVKRIMLTEQASLLREASAEVATLRQHWERGSVAKSPKMRTAVWHSPGFDEPGFLGGTAHKQMRYPDEFKEEVATKTYRNPNPKGTKKQIKFGSLPKEEQRKIFNEWRKTRMKQHHGHSQALAKHFGTDVHHFKALHPAVTKQMHSKLGLGAAEKKGWDPKEQKKALRNTKLPASEVDGEIPLDGSPARDKPKDTKSPGRQESTGSGLSSEKDQSWGQPPEGYDPSKVGRKKGKGKIPGKKKKQYGAPGTPSRWK